MSLFAAIREGHGVGTVVDLNDIVAPSYRNLKRYEQLLGANDDLGIREMRRLRQVLYPGEYTGRARIIRTLPEGVAVYVELRLMDDPDRAGTIVWASELAPPRRTGRESSTPTTIRPEDVVVEVVQTAHCGVCGGVHKQVQGTVTNRTNRSFAQVEITMFPHRDDPESNEGTRTGGVVVVQILDLAPGRTRAFDEPITEVATHASVQRVTTSQVAGTD